MSDKKQNYEHLPNKTFFRRQNLKISLTTSRGSGSIGEVNDGEIKLLKGPFPKKN